VKRRDRRRAGLFGEDAEQYDRARPEYPAALFDHLLRDLAPVPGLASTGADGNPGRIGDSRAVLDVGCGTGIASRLLGTRGCEVLGVEADSRMAAVARRYGLQVEEGRFEEWDPAGRRFDLVVSAQAWHWIDPGQGPVRAAQALKAGGRVGVFWNRGQPPDDLQAAFAAAYERTAPSLGRGYAVPAAARQEPDEDCQLVANGFQGAGGYVDVEVRMFGQAVEYTTAQWLDLLPTHSDHRILPSDQLAALLAAVGAAIDEAGGRFEMRYQTWLAEARKPPARPGRRSTPG
jgi:SAM-dependent methyltransferase